MIMFGRNYYEYSFDTGLLRIHEYEAAEVDVVKIVQKEAFFEEMESLSRSATKRSLPTSSRLFKLHPVVIDGIVRINGHLTKCQWSDYFRQPIIMPSVHPVTNVLIEYYHELEGHLGTNQTISALRTKFCIIKGQKTARNVLAKYITCKRLTGKPCDQQMSVLRHKRIEYDGIPFSSVGSDYFGPLLVKRGRVTEKRYECLFTCLNIREVHLEVTHSLSTKSFSMAFTRFFSRRDVPKNVLSDKGSNLYRN